MSTFRNYKWWIQIVISADRLKKRSRVIRTLWLCPFFHIIWLDNWRNNVLNMILKKMIMSPISEYMIYQIVWIKTLRNIHFNPFMCLKEPIIIGLISPKIIIFLNLSNKQQSKWTGLNWNSCSFSWLEFYPKLN